MTSSLHPFAGLVHIPTAQKLFERAARGDTTITADDEHLRPEVVEAAFRDNIDELSQYDVIMTDSTTAGVASRGHWDEGVAFQGLLYMRQSRGYYKLMWGKGLHDMYEMLTYYRETYGDLGCIAIVIAGNDLSEGRDWCADGLDKVRSLGATVFSAIPPSAFVKVGENPKDCCPDLYNTDSGEMIDLHRPPRRRLNIGEHVRRVHAALGCRCTSCLPEAPAVPITTADSTGDHLPRRLYVFHMQCFI